MAQFSVPTNFRPEIGIAEIPIYYQGNVIAVGVLLREGTFSYELTNTDLLAMLHTGAAQINVSETDGHFFAEVRIQTMNRTSSMS
jgi:hypothetical protein